MGEVFRSEAGEALVHGIGEMLVVKAEISPDDYENRPDQYAYTTLVVLAPKDENTVLSEDERNDLIKELGNQLPPNAGNPNFHEASDRGAIFFGELYITDKLSQSIRRWTSKSEITAVALYDEQALRRLNRTIPTTGVEHESDFSTSNFDVGKIRVVFSPSQRMADAYIAAQQFSDTLPEEMVDPSLGNGHNPAFRDAREIAQKIESDLRLGFIFPELQPAFQVPPEDPGSIENLITNAKKFVEMNRN